MSLAGAPPNAKRTGPSRSHADFWWCKLAAQRHFTVEEIAAELPNVSEKARERMRYDPEYVTRTAENGAAAAERGRQKSRCLNLWQPSRFYYGDMIWDSWCWRSDLHKFALALRKREKQKRWPDTALARCEQMVMVGFFYVRKLVESKKLTRDFADRQFKVTAYPARGKHVHWLNYRRDLDELFDMGSPKQRSMKIEQLANQLVHSYIFYLITDESGPLQGILVASDYIRNDELLSVSIKDIIKIFELAAEGEDDKALSIRYDEKRKDYVVRIANGPFPSKHA